jgi:hypothetical protein
MASRSRIPHPSVDQRRARGQEARNRTPLSRHGRWAAVAERPDPVGLLEEQDAAREPDLVPVRHGRMLVSRFTFSRGAAKLMAADLDGTPTAGLDVQLCGDAHLSNFGLNDVDETLPGPFEYDVKRMAASSTVAGRNNGFTKADTRAATQASVTAYREAMVSFATMGTMDIWYAHPAEDEVSQVLQDAAAEASKTRREPRRPSGWGRSHEGGRQGADARQPAGAVKAHRAGLWRVSDRQQATAHHPGAGPRGHLLVCV